MNQTRDDSDDEFEEMQDWLDDQDGSGAEMWNPDVGGTLIGTFLRYESRFSAKVGGDCKVAIVQEARTGDLYAVWLTRSVLASEYERQAPREGDRIGHKYFGKKDSRSGGQPYHNYTVTVRRAPGGSSPATSPATPPPPSPAPVPVGASTGKDGDDDEIPF